MFYDNADRLIASVDAGTNGGTAWTRPGSVPASSPTLLVTTYAYSYFASYGALPDVVDPMGIDTHYGYDNLGRLTLTIQDYTGQVEGNENDININYRYDGDNNVTLVQVMEAGLSSYQDTEYDYDVTTANGSGVNSNDIPRAIQYPDPSSGLPSTSLIDYYQVNALGQTVQDIDRNGNVHQYSYDVLGRLTSDNVTTLGAGVDGTVRQITYGYDSQGNNNLITSLDANSNIVNQVQRVYNGLGQLTGEYQSHSGAVNTSSTPEVQYAYTEMSGGQNNSRLTSMSYPSGYVLNYNYNTGLDSNFSRLSSISDSGGTLESYKYLGLDTVVERDHPQNNVNLTYISQTGQTGDAGDQYTGLDRFGRVVDQNWYNTTTQTSTVDFQYGYNQDSDVLYKQNLVDAAMSELYQYDNLNQLINFQRGTLNSTKNGISGTPSRSQSWTPDALGNFTGVTTNGTTQTRTANQQNEYTSISGSGTITYDANGNITADGSGNTYVYDAWNRLVAVKNGSTTLAAYGYNGLGERITETHGSTTTDLYYSSNWQVLEERENGQLQARYVWSPAGVDMLVLRDDSSEHNGVLDRRLYVQQDILGNVTALVDTSGNVVERYAYDPFGGVTVLNPDFSVRGTSSYNWNYFFQGKRYDGTVGLYDSRERVYSATLMRPLQTDPLGFAAEDVNLYRYVLNNPTDSIDPNGTFSIMLPPRDLPPIYNDDDVIDGYGYRYPQWFLTALITLTQASNGGIIPNQPLPNLIASAPPGLLNSLSLYNQYGIVGSPAPDFSDGEPVTLLIMPPIAPLPGGGMPRGTLPRAPNGNYLPHPEGTGVAHTVLGRRVLPTGPEPPYTQGATFDEGGNFVGRTDVTDHGRPDTHPNPHFHPRTGPISVGPAQPIPGCPTQSPPGQPTPGGL